MIIRGNGDGGGRIKTATGAPVAVTVTSGTVIFQTRTRRAPTR